MKIETQNYNDITVVKMQGEFTVDTIKMLQDTASSIIADGTPKIVLDMTDVGFIDSQGLEQLLWMKGYCVEHDRQLKLAGMDENCDKIMEITRLSSQFDTYNEVNEAVRSFV